MTWSGWTTRDQAGIDYWEKIASAHVPPEYRTSIMCAVVAGMHAAEHFDNIEADDSSPAAVEIVGYIGTLGHLFGGRDMRFLIDPASLPIGAKLYLKKNIGGAA